MLTVWHHLFSNPSSVSKSPPEMHGYSQSFLLLEHWLSEPPFFLLVSVATASLHREKVLFHSCHLQKLCQLLQSQNCTQDPPASPMTYCVSTHVTPTWAKDWLEQQETVVKPAFPNPKTDFMCYSDVAGSCVVWSRASRAEHTVQISSWTKAGCSHPGSGMGAIEDEGRAAATTTCAWGSVQCIE